MSRLVEQYCTPFGTLLLGSDGNGLDLCVWQGSKAANKLKSLPASGSDCFISMAKEQLDAYFRGERVRFSVPLSISGTEFQQSVWQAASLIPFGKTVSYSELAGNIDKPKAVRAVASALGANKLMVILPCHRILGADGSLTGYAGGLDIKYKLLELEGISL